MTANRRFPISRRNLLQGSAIAALLAPVLRMRDARAGGPTAPRRLILLQSLCGPMMVTGPASGSETNFTFKDWWKPLEPYKADGIFFSNLSPAGSRVAQGPNGGPNGHGLGGQDFAGGGVLSDGYLSAAESIDQTIGKRLEAENRAGAVRSVVWGLPTYAGTCFTANQGGPRPIVPESNPSRAWAAMFNNFVAGGASDAEKARAAAAIARQQSVLDFVNADCVALKNALGTEGMRLLDDHCTTLRSMEKNLTSTLLNTGACAKPADPGQKNWDGPELVDAQSNAFVELMTMSLACELTNVIAFQYGSGGLRLASSYGVPSSPVADSGDSGPAQHPWTHQSFANPQTRNVMRIYTTFYSTQVAKLIGKLKSTIDSSGKPLLDSTMVLWLSELGGNDNNTTQGHICTGIPALLFGGGQGTFRTGRFIQGPSTDIDARGEIEGGRMSAQLLVSLAQYMGLTDMTTIGQSGVNGPLSLLY